MLNKKNRGSIPIGLAFMMGIALIVALIIIFVFMNTKDIGISTIGFLKSYP